MHPHLQFQAAHSGVKGNEIVDLIAKNVLKIKDEEIMKIPSDKAEAKSLIKTKVRELWQKKWNIDNKGRSYCNIQNSSDVRVFKGNCRK